MAKIEAFSGVHYSMDVIEDLSQVVCPPYDVINPLGQEQFYQKHAYNFIRLILGKELAGDTQIENKYTRAAGYFEEWMRRGIFVQDKEPAIYFYEQEFSAAGALHKRFGFIGLMHLGQEGEANAAYPHEHTHAAPKEDRLRVFKAVEANLSPIFTIFSDPKKEMKKLFQGVVKNEKPFLEAVDADGGVNKLWRVTNTEAIHHAQQFIGARDLFIADGHHRFEVAKMFRDYKKTAGAEPFKDSYNTIMTYFTALEDEGLVVLPTHRLIKDAAFSAEVFKPFFMVKAQLTQDALCAEMKKNENNVGAFGLYQKKDGFTFFKIADKKACNQLIKDGPQAYRDLDVAILHKVVFDHLLKISLPQISYEVDLKRAVTAVDTGAADALFILNPTKVEQIKEIALGGEVMPQKSTYFYPKLLSGLVINKF